MLNKLIKIVMPITIFIGIFIVGIAVLAGITLKDGTVISEETITYTGASQAWVWHYYRFHADDYLRSIQESITPDEMLKMLPAMPTMRTAPETWKILDTIKFISNFLFIYLINWIIYIANWVLIAPLKLILYPVNIILALMGINTANNSWINAIETLYSLNIPLIPNIV